MADLVQRLDSWLSALTGLGTRRDKLTSYRFERTALLDDQTCEDLFDQDDVANTIAGSAPEHMFRRGFTVETGDPATDELVEDWNERFDVLGKFVEAATWENVHGGSAIIVGAYDGLPMDQPLNLSTLQQIHFLNVLDKRDLIPREWFDDPRRPDFGLPSVYEIASTWRASPGAGSGMTSGNDALAALRRVHASRMIIFPGPLTSKRTRRANQSWGTSKIARTYDAQKTYAVNWQSISHLIQDASQGVFSISGLMGMIGGGMKEALRTRMEMVDMSRSVARALMLDKDKESYERKDTTFAGLPELTDRSSQRLAMAARMPVSILVGREPAGMNATGELDVRAWYDTLESGRTLRILPRMKQLYRMLFACKAGPTLGVTPAKWGVKFPPLWQPLPKEQADLELAQAQTDAIYLQYGVVTPEAVSLRRFADDPVMQAEIAAELAQREFARAAAAVAAPGTTVTPPTPPAPTDTPPAPPEPAPAPVV